VKIRGLLEGKGKMKKDFIEMYKNISVLHLIPELDPKQAGGYWTVKCPVCERHEAFIYANNPQGIKCSRENNCGNYTSLWDYIQQREGLDNPSTFRFLAKNAGMEIKPPDPEALKQYAGRQKKQAILKAIWEFFRESMPGSDTGKYLKDRGIPAGLLKAFGHFPGIRETLAGMEHKKISYSTVHGVLDFIKSREGYNLIFPFYDGNGDIITFIGRYLGDDPEKGKYLPFGEYSRETFFNTETINRENDRVVIVEGYMDALLLTHYGIPAVAIGSNTPGTKQITDLREFGIKDFIISGDQDTAGMNGKLSGIKKIRQSGGRAYILDVPEGKDPDEYIRKNGIDAFKELYKYPKNDYIWELERITADYDDMGPIDQEMLFNDIKAVGSRLEDPKETEVFNRMVGEITGYAPETIDQVIGTAREKVKKRELNEKATTLTAKASDLLAAGKTKKALDLLTREAKTIDDEIFDKTITLQTAGDIMQTKGHQEFIISGPNDFGMFPPAGVSALVAHPGVGKSFLCLDLCMKISQGIPWLGKYDTMKKNCLFIDEENGPIRLKKRLELIGNNPMTGGTDLPENFYFLSFSGVDFSDPAWSKAIKRTIQDQDIGFVVIDSFVDVFTGDENSVKDVQPVMHAIRTLATETRSHFLLIHHEKKEGGYRGSSAFNGAVDLMIKFELVTPESKDKQGNIIPANKDDGYYFESTKARDTDEFLKTIEMKIVANVFGIKEKTNKKGK